jgi:hypothetical protein
MTQEEIEARQRRKDAELQRQGKMLDRANRLKQNALIDEICKKVDPAMIERGFTTAN